MGVYSFVESFSPLEMVSLLVKPTLFRSIQKPYLTPLNPPTELINLQYNNLIVAVGRYSALENTILKSNIRVALTPLKTTFYVKPHMLIVFF